LSAVVADALDDVVAGVVTLLELQSYLTLAYTARSIKKRCYPVQLGTARELLNSAWYDVVSTPLPGTIKLFAAIPTNSCIARHQVRGCANA